MNDQTKDALLAACERAIDLGWTLVGWVRWGERFEGESRQVWQALKENQSGR